MSNNISDAINALPKLELAMHKDATCELQESFNELAEAVSNLLNQNNPDTKYKLCSQIPAKCNAIVLAVTKMKNELSSSATLNLFGD